MTELGSHFEKNASAAMTKEHSITPCRIFLVEDNPDDLMLSKKRLEASPNVGEVRCFANGDELISYMQHEGFQDHSVMCLVPTLILIDLNMPRMDGFEVLNQLKSDPFLQEIPVIVISGDSSYESVQRAHDLKANGFFKKPLNVQKVQSFFSKGWQWPAPEMWMY
jgi:CheY-like chemotaxis protein